MKSKLICCQHLVSLQFCSSVVKWKNCFLLGVYPQRIMLGNVTPLPYCYPPVIS
jgi:hypothetical protein